MFGGVTPCANTGFTHSGGGNPWKLDSIFNACSLLAVLDFSACFDFSQKTIC